MNTALLNLPRSRKVTANQLTPSNLFCQHWPWVSASADSLDCLICFLPNRAPGTPPFGPSSKFPLISSLSTQPSEYNICWVGWLPHSPPWFWKLKSLLWLRREGVPGEQLSLTYGFSKGPPWMESLTSKTSSDTQVTLQKCSSFIASFRFSKEYEPLGDLTGPDYNRNVLYYLG